MEKGCSVIIPVYNGFEETITCLESVAANSGGLSSAIVIDDASPNGELRELLPSMLRDNPLFEFRRNERNLGFVGTCNLGMRLAEGNDVVLLNSDTEVTPGWIEKLRRAAYHRPNVGTVTPLTNNGTICSIPRFCRSNELPEGLGLDEYAQLIEQSSQNSYPELPTCVGFCVYLKREVLDQVGGFDEEAFGRGYGEENDFSLRAQRLGFQDVLDDSTFVYHKGNVSFGAAQQELAAQNSEVIRSRYPHYFDTVARFCQANPLRGVHLQILDKLLYQSSAGKASPKKRILHILQNGPHLSRREGFSLGGTELHVQELINEIPDYAHWSLVPTKRCYYLTAHLSEYGQGFEREFILDLRHTSLAKILNPDYFDLVHLHHSRYYDHIELCQALHTHGNYVVSLHDFILVCPRFHLYTPFRQVCNGHECSSACGYKNSYISEYREYAQKLLKGAQRVISFSKSTQRYVENITGDTYDWECIPHGIQSYEPGLTQRSLEPPVPVGTHQPLKIAFLGYVPQHKGSLIVQELIKHERLPCGVPIEWHVIGKLFLENIEPVIDHGEYEAHEIFEKLSDVDPHLVLILSICPETYCLTLDEAWNSGVPVVVTPHGAPAERVQESGAGWVLSDLLPQTVMKQLDSIASDWSSYQEAFQNLKNVKIGSVEQESQAYKPIYDRVSDMQDATDPKLLHSYLRGFGLERPPDVGVFGRILSQGMNKVIYILDALQVRAQIHRALNRLLPARLMRELKSLR